MPLALKPAMKHWFAVEAIPIVVLVTGMVSFASYFTYRSAMGPSIQWSKKNPEPWNSIRPNEGVKMVQINQKFDKTWRREHL
ncbi:hypothetical protein B0H11DRAFT_1290902 [Mycena galericulata]|nr:hypothetical protein B0H11DRAFT_1290902 [Mycena galericulata]